jgi:DNA-binding XRE family transcriptional regulator
MSDATVSKLRAWREGAGLSVSRAAANAGVARQTWHSWERGGSIPPARYMPKLHEMTGGAVTPNDFHALAPAEGQAA